MRVLLLLSYLLGLFVPSLHTYAYAENQNSQKKSSQRPKSVLQRREQKRNGQPSCRAPTRSSRRAQKTSPKAMQKQDKNTLSWIPYANDDYSLQIPNNWQGIDDKTQLPEKLDVVFIGPGTGSLTPTINIAQEITSKTQPEYIEEILAYHRSDEKTLTSSVFTQIAATNGSFTIIKTEKSSSWGKVFCLQAVIILNHCAYILTSTTTLDDYPTVSLIFLKTVSSFQLSDKTALSGDSVLEEALKQLNSETN